LSMASSDYPHPHTAKMPSISKYAILEQDSLNKVPILLPGDVTPSVMCQYKNTCMGFFESKEIAPDKQARKILAGLHDDCIQDWISINHDQILELTFTQFMVKLKAGFLPEDWEEITWIELLTMQQSTDFFWDFMVQVQSKNTLLHDTDSYLDKDQLHHHIKSGMNPKLTLCCHHEKSNKVIGFKNGLQM